MLLKNGREKRERWRERERKKERQSIRSVIFDIEIMIVYTYSATFNGQTESWEIDFFSKKVFGEGFFL